MKDVKVLSTELKFQDYVVELQLPDDSIIKILIPNKEFLQDVYKYSYSGTGNIPDVVYGLNFVVDGHYI